MGRYQEVKNEEGRYPLVAVAIDKDKGSQNALKWAVDNLVSRGQMITLVHVNTKGSSSGSPDDIFKEPTDPHMKELFLPFRCFCTRKDIECRDVVIDETDVAKSIVEFVSHAAIEKLVVGASPKGSFVRFKNSEISTSISKAAPDFCSVYVISKGKVSSVKNAIRQAPTVSPLRTQIQNKATQKPQTKNQGKRGNASPETPRFCDDSIKSPFARAGNGMAKKSYPDISSTESSDISFISSGRPSLDRSLFTPRLSNGSDGFNHSFDMPQNWQISSDSFSTGNELSSISNSTETSWSSQGLDDVEAEMKRLRLELKQTMDMYSTACKEALTAKQKAMELHRWKMEEEHRLEEARLAEEAALALVAREKAKCKAAMEAAEASQRIAELEAKKRINAEKTALREAEEKRRALDALSHTDIRYRKYTIDEIETATEFFNESRKIGEGGYGPVYKCYLDHTPVAVKVLRPDAAQGRSQFQQEVEVLSCIRHPNMVLLLGACPEYGCLVYEYMANGSLDDRLFRRGDTPVIPWQHRFRIAAEIATGLLFLHQTKPEPLVHRDLKPGNILLDVNFVSKISDVGLARLVPPSVADTVTQYRMTSTAGTFCYIDPEYQQTGMLGVKSDIYSLGVMLLQIVTSKSPMGLTHHVSRAIEKGTFAEMLDPAVTDWPVEEAQRLAELALKCAELRRKDRPDLATIVLPELNRLRSLAAENLQHCVLRPSQPSSPLQSNVSQLDVVRSEPLFVLSRCSPRASGSSAAGMRSNVS